MPKTMKHAGMNMQAKIHGATTTSNRAYPVNAHTHQGW